MGRGKEYSIKKGVFSSALIKGKTSSAEWIITDKYIYGINKAVTNAEYEIKEYYIIDRKRATVTVFDDLRNLNNQLKTMGLPSYNMSKSENIVHLKYGGRNRKFKL